ncbi:hypothetical protein Gbro_0529 [Gordonia bronchialis DSM 43247]|uniref:Uncharacterized protein n=1 Tax=Gordonia bronchialis (strain ATCC 25592 / DSM 43247 / BCRC 13721 / JCM 3198 / KCTC 3076 / NBRC 16047 / NCTC 10667) TaxID=526226 RepID=D0LEE1_GORB4|nr:hypothetical protein [Gordonia bronchialis]ACY19859.1 hypothetical protein Gbro_0529 [Gordonia bronchialis DSM 43247]MCC3322632.1 hypothetical protein [Gordonia bronchialis]STQ62636.1 Uncharacterised protein [Gordonia bronchialis]
MLIDVPNMVGVANIDGPVHVDGPGLALVTLRAYTPGGARIGTRDQAIAIVDDLDSVRLVAVRDRPRWRPDPRIATVDRLMARVGPIDPTSTRSEE